MALYPYTLQPVDLNLTDAEFRQAQTQLFDSNNQQLTRISTKTWVIVGIISAIALAGIIFLQGYSTIIFWLMLVGVVIYLLARTYGLKWYVKQEFDKQISGQSMPEEMKTMKIGIQQHGLVMTMPMTNVPKMPKGYNSPLVRGGQMQQAIIKWENISNWQETADFIVMMFNVEGQQGSQIIPKRLEKQKFPIGTLRNHLQEHVGIQGFDLKDKATDKYFPDPNLK
ncbi:YcxB family protein [Faucicola boevrei]|uniref:YcxB family protein n=1 Tax=Faucicola boevrei TaxID=346665 RepID=UPI000365745E|nr:YcxB family protein [Moraxella boevrei]